MTQTSVHHGSTFIALHKCYMLMTSVYAYHSDHVHNSTFHHLKDILPGLLEAPEPYPGRMIYLMKFHGLDRN
eukprot:7476224-Ditylum_brightwellii.AAC.1